MQAALTEDTLSQNLQQMTQKNSGMDVLIIVTSDPEQEKYWEHRLNLVKPLLAHAHSLIITTHENWPGGAGNGLGTLYAYEQAKEKAKSIHDFDLVKAQSQGACIAMYHTAGKGTRLSPLTGSECNNKPAVKLPSLLDVQGKQQPLTLLEAVLMQTKIFAKSRKGRLSVFWGDQIFIPSSNILYEPSHHVDVLVKQLAPIDSKSWSELGLSNYGLIFSQAAGTSFQVEKIDFTSFQSLIEKQPCQVGMSLGSFSLSYEMTQALLQEYAEELKSQRVCLNSDPDFWMPMTLKFDLYRKLMENKGTPLKDIAQQHKRMQNFQKRFSQRHPQLSLFGPVDVGQESYWWDYGTLPSFYQNCLALSHSTPQAQAMRDFFQIKTQKDLGPEVDIDEESVVIGCSIKKGKIRKSVLVAVDAQEVQVEHSVLIQSKAQSFFGQNFLSYNVFDKESIHFTQNSSRADAFPLEHLKFFKSLNQHKASDWDSLLGDNPLSFSQLYSLNQQVGLTRFLKKKVLETNEAHDIPK